MQSSPQNTHTTTPEKKKITKTKRKTKRKTRRNKHTTAPNTTAPQTSITTTVPNTTTVAKEDTNTAVPITSNNHNTTNTGEGETDTNNSRTLERRVEEDVLRNQQINNTSTIAPIEEPRIDWWHKVEGIDEEEKKDLAKRAQAPRSEIREENEEKENKPSLGAQQKVAKQTTLRPSSTVRTKAGIAKIHTLITGELRETAPRDNGAEILVAATFKNIEREEINPC
eukprot:TRINITY_DN4285_c0_g1_i3.p1 TRINITY_DN4285_c0_g1~~TRINITY_DN4285_c0_g1_i3.p1  ORF type:complete len:225 (+),score=48.92 TRINITY_DN4285_c0_g1_i3:774-1448(+)